MLSSYRLLFGQCNDPILFGSCRPNISKQIPKDRINTVAECADLRLSASAASGEYRDPWKFTIDATNRSKKAENLQNGLAWVGPVGFGPTTPCLRGRCSNQTELQALGCRGEDLNLHELLHTHLKRARLPFRHLGNL
ncbi:MAG: hypothetical protein ACD_40C00012G0004 [uncultured bacterium]|nr:MAG: hypothetical protein ACD_40C00012G0004 [uncultured bacterium]